MKYDAAVSNTEEEYAAFVEWLEDRTASELRVARGNEDATRAAILKYLETGYTAHLTPSELVDFFCVDSPNILDKAGYPEGQGDEESDAVVAIFDEINNVTWSRFYPG